MDRTERANLKKRKGWQCMVINFVSVEDDPQAYSLPDYVICIQFIYRILKENQVKGIRYFRPCLSQDFYKTFE